MPTGQGTSERFDGKADSPGQQERVNRISAFPYSSERLRSAMAQTEPESTQVPPPFGITRTPLGDTITIAASGELDAATAPRLQEAINRDRKGCARLVLDLTALSFIDSMGLSVLLQAKKLSQEHGFDLFVIPSQHDEVKRLFDVTDAEQALRPDPDDEATPTG